MLQSWPAILFPGDDAKRFLHPKVDVALVNNGVLIRELRKSAHFAPGEPLDTEKTPNTTVAVPKPRDKSRALAGELIGGNRFFSERGVEIYQV